MYDDQTLSVAAFLRGITRIERYLSAEEVSGSIVWLDVWAETARG